MKISNNMATIPAGSLTHKRSSNITANTAIVTPAANLRGVMIFSGYVLGGVGVGILAKDSAPVSPTDANAAALAFADLGSRVYIVAPVFVAPGVGVYDSSLTGGNTECHFAYKVL